MENYLCRKYIKQVRKELQWFFYRMQKRYNVWNTELAIISETAEMRTRSDVLKEFCLDSEQIMEQVLQYMEQDCSLMRTIANPHVDDDGFHYRTKIIIPNKQLNYAVISGSSEPDFLISYLKLILKHEVGHAIATTEKYGKCVHFIEFAHRKRIDNKIRAEELKKLDVNDPDYYVHYYTEVTDEREANEAVDISIEEIVRFHKRYEELVNTVLENHVLFSHELFDDGDGDEDGN